MNAPRSREVRSSIQTDLFGDTPPSPEGFRYRPALISETEEADLAGRLAALPFEPFDFHGHLANRQVVGFGFRYDYSAQRVRAADPIPDFLFPLRERVGAFAGLPAQAFEQMLINAYPPGAGIGWHRDKPQFEAVVGISLLAPCPFRFRRKAGERWDRITLAVEPRSAYLLTGSARHAWEHSIPPLDRLRYSITFRTLARRE